jgi:hypothetical protein
MGVLRGRHSQPKQLHSEAVAAASHPPPHPLPAAGRRLRLLLACINRLPACRCPHTPCRKENNGNDPTVNLINKAGGWGASGGGGGDAQGGSSQPERSIPAQPSAAWGGAGLPEERKKQVGGRVLALGAGCCSATCWRRVLLAASCGACLYAAVQPPLPGCLPTRQAYPLLMPVWYLPVPGCLPCLAFKFDFECRWRWPASRSSRPSGTRGAPGGTTTTRRCTTRTTGAPGMPTSAAMQVGGGLQMQGTVRGK